MAALARVLGTSSFGVFTLAYTTLLFGNSLQTALITQPHNVLGSTLRGIEYVEFNESLMGAQGALAGALSGLLVGATIAAYLIGWDLWPVLLALVPTMLAWQTQEFVRRVFYTEDRLGEAFMNDVVSYGGQAILILLLWRAQSVSEFSALSAIAVTSFVAAIIGARQLRVKLRRARQPRRDHLRHSWDFGKWLAASTLSNWFSTQIYLYLAAGMLGAGSAGLLRAVDIPFRPLAVLLTYLDTTLPIRFSRTHTIEGNIALRSAVRRVILVTAPMVIVYVVVMGFVGQWLIVTAFGQDYSGASKIVWIVSLSYLMSYAARIASAYLRAKRLTRIIFVAQFVAGCVAILGGWSLVSLWGLPGVATGGVITWIIVNMILWTRYIAEGRTPVYARESPKRNAAS